MIEATLLIHAQCAVNQNRSKTFVSVTKRKNRMSDASQEHRRRVALIVHYTAYLSLPEMPYSLTLCLSKVFFFLTDFGTAL